MKRISKSMVLILAALMVLQPVLSWAGSGARVIPQGKVSILEEGKEVTQFQSELPLPEGTMLLCNGNCLVQTQNLQFVALDRAVFALTEGKTQWNLTVKSGQVDFALRPDAKPVSFQTPLDTIQMQRAIMPASGSAVVRGSIRVSETESILSVQEGALQVMGPDGTLLVDQGRGIRLAATTTSAAGTKTAAASDDTYTIAGITAEKTTWYWVGAGVLAAIGLGVGLGVGLSGGGDGGTPASPK